jgi:hypothetical protein
MTKLTKYLCIIAFLSLALNLSAQFDDDEEGKWGEFFISPDLGLMIGTTTRIEVAPMLGYYLTNRLSLAAGGRFEYYNYSKRYYGPLGFETSIYGPRFQARYVFLENSDNILPLRLGLTLFLQAEHEILSLEKKYFEFPRSGEDGRYWHNFTFIGAGVRQQVGRNSYVNLAVLWDINQQISSPYANPLFRFGLQFGLRSRR